MDVVTLSNQQNAAAFSKLNGQTKNRILVCMINCGKKILKAFKTYLAN